jgi:hypothetical protein
MMPTLPLLSRKATSASPKSMSRKGSLSAVSSRDKSAGIQ